MRTLGSPIVSVSGPSPSPMVGSRVAIAPGPYVQNQMSYPLAVQGSFGSPTPSRQMIEIEDRRVARDKMVNECQKGAHHVPYRGIMYKKKLLEAKKAEHNARAQQVALEALQRAQASAAKAFQQQQALEYQEKQLDLEEAIIACEEAKWEADDELINWRGIELHAADQRVHLKNADLAAQEMAEAEKAAQAQQAAQQAAQAHQAAQQAAQQAQQ